MELKIIGNISQWEGIQCNNSREHWRDLANIWGSCSSYGYINLVVPSSVLWNFTCSLFSLRCIFFPVILSSIVKQYIPDTLGLIHNIQYNEQKVNQENTAL